MFQSFACSKRSRNPNSVSAPEGGGGLTLSRGKKGGGVKTSRSFGMHFVYVSLLYDNYNCRLHVLFSLSF